MEPPCLRTAACLQCRLRPITSSKKIPRYSAELARQMAERFIALSTFTPCLSMGLLNSHLATSVSPIDGFRAPQ